MMPTTNSLAPLCRKGLDAELLEATRRRIEAAVVERAALLYRPGAGPDDLGRPELKSLERVLHFYDLQACCISPLARMAAAGSAAASRSVQAILSQARRYLTEVQPKSLPVPLRRLLLHLARAYGFLAPTLDAAQSESWRQLIGAAAEDLLDRYHRFHPGLQELNSGTVGTGLNHYVIAAEGVFWAGRVLGNAQWCDLASDFIRRLIGACHPDGYFEEHTNAAREGGPAVDYMPLNWGPVHHVTRAEGMLPRHRGLLARCTPLWRSLTDTNLNQLCFADERTNRRGLRTFGWAAHSLEPRGRGYLRLLLDGPLAVPIESWSPEMLARLDFELDAMETGPGELPEPWLPGDTALTLPLAVRRRGGWTAGLSALRALNYVLFGRGGDYAMDRQNLLCLSHESAGGVLAGLKSKRDPDFSTLRVDDDAYPMHTGALTATDDELAATVRYETFSARVAWRLDRDAMLLLSSDSTNRILMQLLLDLSVGAVVTVNEEPSFVLGTAPVHIESVRRVASETWSAESDHSGVFRWPLRPHDPYNEGNRCGPDAQRASWSIPWTGACRVRFALDPSLPRNRGARSADRIHGR